MRRRRKGGPLGKILTLFLLLCAAGVIYYIYTMNMIPMKYLALIAAGAVVVVGLVGFLTWNFYSRGKFVIGMFLWFAVLMVLAVSLLYVRQTKSTIEEITTSDVEVSAMGVFVKSDSAAASIPETTGSSYGILRELDRENTDAALEKIQAELGAAPATTEYDGLTELVNGLVAGETGAIVLNEAYVDVIRELEGFANLDSMIREIATEEVETEIQLPPAQASYTQPSGDAGTTEGTADTGDGTAAPAPVQVQQTAPPIQNKDVLVVYVSGIDNRGGIVAKSRSDVNIVAVANMATKQMLLINTPRDYFVPLSISNGAPDKLTHAGIYGINVSMDTLSMLYNVPIPFYIKVNFQGFIDIIDALGGIDVYSDYEFSSKNELGWYYYKGINHMDGAAALTFARERFSFADGDRQRGKNQMAVIQAIMKKAISTDLIRNYSAIMKSLEGSFETNISYEEIANIMMRQLEDGGEWNLVTYSVNGTGDTQKPYSLGSPAYVMVPDQSTVDTAKQMIQDVIGGSGLIQVEEEASALLSEEEANAIAAEANGLLTPTPAHEDAAAGTAAGGTAAAPADGTAAAAAAPADGTAAAAPADGTAAPAAAAPTDGTAAAAPAAAAPTDGTAAPAATGGTTSAPNFMG